MSLWWNFQDKNFRINVIVLLLLLDNMYLTVFIFIIFEAERKLEIQFQNSTNACLPGKKLEIQNLIISGRIELRNINIEYKTDSIVPLFAAEIFILQYIRF